MLADMDVHGVASVVVATPGPGAWYGDVDAARQISRLWNEKTARLAQNHPGRVGFFALIAPPDVDGALKEIEYAFDTLKADGIGLLTSYNGKYLGDASFAPVYAELNRRKAVIYVHPLAPNCCSDVVPGIPPGSIEEAAAWVEERHDLLSFHGDRDVEEGATIVHTDRGASALYFLDAGGNVAELIANDHLDERSVGPFGPQSLLEVAEIGVATADTEGTRSVIQETLSADVLWGGREGWLLTAIGDDHGVVIVAPVGRGWIPIGLPARPLPTTIVADAPHAREALLPEGPYRIRAISSH
jgi:hypothetical protein